MYSLHIQYVRFVVGIDRLAACSVLFLTSIDCHEPSNINYLFCAQ